MEMKIIAVQVVVTLRKYWQNNEKPVEKKNFFMRPMTY